MDYNLSVGIVSVPKRYNYAKKLKASLEFEGFSPVVAMDIEYRGSWVGHKKAMQTITPEATHHLVLEEDAVICKNFKERVYSVIQARPQHIISLFASREQKNKFEWCRRNGVHWFVNAYGAPGVAVIFPRDLLQDHLSWEIICPQDMPYEDSRLWGWMEARNLLTWNPVPNLIEHGAPMSSSFGFNNKGKVSYDFIGDREDFIDWNKGLNPDKVFKYITGQATFEKYTRRHHEEKDK